MWVSGTHDTGSIPVRRTRARSSVGRTPHSHCGNQGFDSPRVHRVGENVSNDKLKSMKKIKGELLQVAQLGHGILRKKAKKVKDVKSPEIQKLIKDLISTVMDVDGVGIAAPQVYKSIGLGIQRHLGRRFS